MILNIFYNILGVFLNILNVCALFNYCNQLKKTKEDSEKIANLSAILIEILLIVFITMSLLRK
jgi:uncharacterized membrane protein